MSSNSEFCVECQELGEMVNTTLTLTTSPCFRHEILIADLKKYLLAAKPLLNEYIPELKFDYKDLKATIDIILK